MRVLKGGAATTLFLFRPFIIIVVVVIIFRFCLFFFFGDEADAGDGERQTSRRVVQRDVPQDVTIVIEDADEVLGDIRDEDLVLLRDGGRDGDETRTAVAFARPVIATRLKTA